MYVLYHTWIKFYVIILVQSTYIYKISKSIQIILHKWFIYLFIHLSIYLFSISLFVYLLIYLFIWFIYMYVFIYLFIYVIT